ncbi:ATP-binding protein [Azotosporobacter soli]|uniref:ATP-binding protein n=1 Tax=Azotosporobacter soli TaxID=3055040 RepID=UPI0031FF2AA2
MTEEGARTEDELSHLKERMKRLAMEKSNLQLMTHLMSDMSAVPGLERTIDNLLRTLLENIGGLNVSLYYRIDEKCYYADVYGDKKEVADIDDKLVAAVFKDGEFIECKQEFSDTKMLTPVFDQAATWLIPLKVDSAVFGVLKMEKLHIGAEKYRAQLPVLFKYAALLLKNEISGHTRLQKAYEQISQINEQLRNEIDERKKIQNDLLEARNGLERRVEERTQELKKTNKHLSQEISDRKQAETALLASEEKFSKAFQKVADAIGIVRLCDERYIEANAAFFRILGYQREEVIGHTSREFGLWSNEADRIGVYEALSGKNLYENMETAWRTKSGEVRIGLHSAEIVEIDGQWCSVFIWHDITERKYAEEQLRLAHKQLEVKVKERTQELFNANLELSGLNEEHLAMNAELVAINNKLLNTNRELHKEIAERKKAEEQVQVKSYEIQEAYAELKKAQMQIVHQEKMASVGQLAAGVAHEINNPMGFIISNLTTLQEYTREIFNAVTAQDSAVDELGEICKVGYEKEAIQSVVARLAKIRQSAKMEYLREDTKELLADSLDGAERVKKIVQDLKGVAKTTDENNLANLNEGIESTINVIWNEIKSKATLVKEWGDIPYIYCNSGQLKQVIMNLLLNALQAIENKGEIRIKTWAEKEHVFVSITDTGCGMMPEVISRVFEPFFTTREIGQGTGLGLSVSYDIVKKHGGEIKVESQLGQGTTFTIVLPVSKS